LNNSPDSAFQPYLKPLLEIAQKITHVPPRTDYRLDTPARKTQGLGAPILLSVSVSQ